MSFILSIDQGTTGSTAILINSKTFELVDKVNQEYPQIFPKPGWVEHNLNDIWKSVVDTVKAVMEKNNVTGKDIQCIGITNQRETICAFDPTGEPLYHALVWQDRRTSDFCAQLKSQGKEELFKKKTGLPIDPYFSGTKIHWLLNNADNVKNAASSGTLKLGNIDTYLLYKLSGGTAHKTEPSNASRTLLMDLKTCDWDEELMGVFGVKKEWLPDICDSFGEFGQTNGLDFLPDGIPISGILGDQQAALFGQGGFQKGGMKCTYGTGSFLLLNTDKELKYSNSGLLTTVAFQSKGMPSYAIEGSCFIAGAAVQWLRDSLKIIKSSPEVEKLAGEIENLESMEHVMFLPFLTGLGSPHWIPEGKGAIVGITRDTTDAHIARATLEGVALSINDLIEALKKDLGEELKELRVDGGACANDLFMQIQADASNLKIVRPEVIETTAYGAALAAGLGAGIINFDQIGSLVKINKEFPSDSSTSNYYTNKKSKWNDFISRLYH